MLRMTRASTSTGIHGQYTCSSVVGRRSWSWSQVDSHPQVMFGSQSVAAWIAQLTFWAVLIVGAAMGELSRKAAVAFVVLWVAGVVGLPRASALGSGFTTTYVAFVDIALVFMVFKGDV